jgi:lipopolysaccharide transport system ATP-binding protein
MNEIILKIENLSKQYRLGTVGTGTLSHDLNRWWHKVRGKEDPFLKIGETNNRATKGTSDYVWALKDINFEVKKGEVLGIIGKNGAGKSTLLKILSKVTGPSIGSIKSNGRIASLLEVGTGFHPELTGRENIYLNGAILGMTKAEINSKIDEIVSFSGCERYIDTPVKRYSSGMTVRLAFSVAAHLEPDILVIDEVLAVGDAEFQKKAIGKMQDISKGEGRTVLFVSHNMAAVQNLCTRAIVLQHGCVAFDGNVEDSILFYLKGNLKSESLIDIEDRKGNGKVKVKSVDVYGNDTNSTPISGSKLNFNYHFNNPFNILVKDVRFDFRIDDVMGQRIAWFSTVLKNTENNENIIKSLNFEIERCNLNQGIYYATTYIEVNKELSDHIQNAFSFEIFEGDFYKTGKKIPIVQSKVLMDFNLNY